MMRIEFADFSGSLKVETMKMILATDGLAARRQTSYQVKTLRSSFFLTAIFASIFLLSSCHEKTNGQSANQKTDRVVVDSTEKPKVSIQVNRRFDDKGNLIGFDSTYSSFYSNVSGDTSRMDSMMSHFDTFFNKNHSYSFDRQFNSLFFDDSLRYPDFFHKDFFMKRYELNDAYLRDMMHRMDSVKNAFYEKESRRSQK
jgi:hypothetical protein